MPDLIAIVDDCDLAQRQLAVARSRLNIAILASTSLQSPGDLPTGNLYFDVDLAQPAIIQTLRRKLNPARTAGEVIFAVPRDRRASAVQAYALGATSVIRLPVEAEALALQLDSLLKLFDSKAPDTLAAVTEAAASAATALSNVFAAALGQEMADIPLMRETASGVADAIVDEGISRWVVSVHRHHRSTYQHCLLVMGLAAAFGNELGMRFQDLERLTMAGLLHDIGKASVPVEILDKPSRLTDAEMAVMKQHPVIGYDKLKAMAGTEAELLDVVRHHHEYLDGTGYPDGLRGADISDLTRMMTISDVFGALIENRSYKPPLASADAYAILEGMAGKLEVPLIRAFRPVAAKARAA